MLLLIGSIICILVNAGNGVIVVSPPGSPLYFPVGVPATISCTAKAVSGNVEDSYLLVQLANATNANSLNALICSPLRTGPLTAQLYSPSLGNANLSRSFPDQSTINCSYTLLFIRDGTYTCMALSTSVPSVEQGFEVVTTKQADGVSINNGNPQITAKEGDSINVTCLVINSKPAYSVSWNLPDIANVENNPSLALQSTPNGFTNSSISQTVVAAASMNGRTLTCNASPSTPNLAIQSANAVFNIYYGPSNISSQVSTSNGTFNCLLQSNPPITTYTWWLDDASQAQCTAQSCTLPQQLVQAGLQVTCEGRNPLTNQFARSTMGIVWLASSTGAAAVTGASKTGDQSTVLSDGAIAGIVIGTVAFLVLVIVVPVVVCTKRKRSKGASAGSDTNANRRSMPPASSAQASSRPYNFENTSGHKSSLSAQPDVVRNSGFSPSASDPGQPHKAPSTPPPAYPGAMDMIDQKPRSRKPIALYDTALDDAYPNQTNASYMPSPKY